MKKGTKRGLEILEKGDFIKIISKDNVRNITKEEGKNIFI